MVKKACLGNIVSCSVYIQH